MWHTNAWLRVVKTVVHLVDQTRYGAVILYSIQYYCMLVAHQASTVTIISHERGCACAVRERMGCGRAYHEGIATGASRWLTVVSLGKVVLLALGSRSHSCVHHSMAHLRHRDRAGLA